MFEGEYLNGKRNGKGKDYYLNGKLRFEGEYLNGERLNGKLFDKKGNIYLDLQNANGLIKEYNVYGRLEFEGEYLNGKKNGKGKEYDYFGRLIFEGEYINGKRNGKGKEYKYGNLIFEGEYFNGVKWTTKGLQKSHDVIYELSSAEICQEIIARDEILSQLLIPLKTILREIKIVNAEIINTTSGG